MRSIKLLAIALILTGMFSYDKANAQIKIGKLTDALTIEPAALLELESNSQGFLLPRMGDFNAINALNPPPGMMVYKTTSPTGIYVRNSGGWERLGGLTSANAFFDNLTVTNTVTARVFTGDTFNGELIGNASTATNAENALNATTALNLASGSGGTIPYQTGDGLTAMLPNGISGQILQSRGLNNSPIWVNGGAGDMRLDLPQTVIAPKTFNPTTFILAGSESGSTILNAAPIASGTVTLPAGGTLVTLDGIETLTRKILTAPIVNDAIINSPTINTAILTTPALGTPISGEMTNVSGTATNLTAGTAINLRGGGVGSLPYQKEAGITAMLPAGLIGQVLQSNGATTAPSWITPPSLNDIDANSLIGTTLAPNVFKSSLRILGILDELTVSTPINGSITGNANTATNAENALNANKALNLAGGSGGTIPYQSGPGATEWLANGLAGQILQSNGTSLAPTWVNGGAGDMILGSTQTVIGPKTFKPTTLILGGSNSGTTILNAAPIASGTVTLPAGGTLATHDGFETLTNKTITAPIVNNAIINSPTINTAVMTAPDLGTPISGVMTNVSGTATNLTVGKALNLNGGAGGQVLYQSAAGVTAMLPNGLINQVLQSNGTTTAPSWVTPAALIPINANALVGTTLAPSVINSSLTSVGILGGLTVTTPIVGSVTGNAATATALATPRTINGLDFDGTAPIVITAAAETLTGTGLNAAVVGSSLTSVGVLGNLTVTAPIAGSVTGNASTANTLFTPRTINGVSFNGSSNIVVPADALTLTGTTLPNAIVGSNLQSVGTLGSLTVTAPIVGSVTGSAATAGSAITAATVTGPAQPAITSVGTLTGLSVTAPIAGSVTGSAATVTGTAQPAITSVGTLTGLTVTAPIVGSVTGSAATAGTAITAQTVTDAAQPAITSVGTLTGLSVTAPIAGSVTGSAATVTANAQPAITSVGTLTGLTVTGPIAGSVTGSSTTAQTVTAPAQPAITSVGTLTGLTVTVPIAGSVTGSAATVTGNAQPAITSVGTLTGLTVTAPIAGSVTGSAATAGSATTAQTVTDAAQPAITSVGTLNGLTVTAPIAGSVTGSAATVTSNAQPAITSVGILTGLTVTAPIVGSVTGSAASAGSATTAQTVTDAAQPAITSVGTLAGLSVTAPIAGSVTGSAATVTGNAQLAITSVGTLTGLTVTAPIVGSITGSAGTAVSATTAATVTAPAQTAITSVGTLTGLSVTAPIAGSVTGSAATVTGNAQPAITSVGTLTGLTVTTPIVGSITGSAASAGSATTALTVTAPAQPAITSVGTLTGLSVIAPIAGSVTGSAATVTGNAQPAITSVGTLTGLTVTNPIVGSITGSAASAGSATTAVTVTAPAQPAITSVGTLTGLSVTAPIAGSVTGSAATVTGVAQPAITSVGTLTGLTVTAPITGSVTGSAATAGSATTAQTVTDAAQPAITSLGTLTGLTVSVPIIGSVTGSAATVSGAAQPAITSVGTLTGLTVTGPIGGSVTGSAATVTGVAQPAITSLGTLTGLTVTAPITGSVTGSAGSSTNLLGGLGGSIPYQTAVNTTSLLANGNAGQVLQSNGGTNPPSWINHGDMTLAGNETFTGEKTFGIAGNVGKLVVAGSVSGVTTIDATPVAANGVVTLPNSGTLTTTANLISDFANTTSTQLRGKITDGTGTGALVFGTAPTISAVNLTGIPLAPTAAPATNSFQVATTAYADAAVTASSAGKQNLLTNSAGLAGALSDETGSDAAVFANTPTLITPVLGAAQATTINNLTITPTAGGATLNIANGGELSTVNAFPIELTATAATTLTLPTSGTLATTTTLISDFGASTSAQLANKISDETGNGFVVYSNGPVLTVPVLGVAEATSVNKVAITPPATSATLTLADGSTLVTLGGFSTTLTATGGTALTLPTSGTLATLDGGEALINKSINGNTISPGTGTLTLDAGSALVTSGANSITLTSGGATNVTLPLTGTLATLDGGEALTNKSINGNTISPSTGTLTLDAGSALVTSGANSITLTSGGATNVTLPTTGTLVAALSATDLLDFPNTIAGESSNSATDITVLGALVGDVVSLGISDNSMVGGGVYVAWVSAADTVTVRFANTTAGALDPGPESFNVRVLK